jgi:hypothetical protein
MHRHDVEHEIERILVSIGPWTRAELHRVLSLPDEERAVEIGALYANLDLRILADVLIDLETKPTAREVILALLREPYGSS